MIRKSQYSILLLFTFLLLIGKADAQNLRDYISLNGKWYFSIGDNTDWARYHYNHFEWEQIRVPSPWEQQGFNGYDGFAWYRREVHIGPEAKELSLWLDLGYIDDADEVYLNGELINRSGQFPPAFKTAYNAHRLYKLPSQHIRYNQANVIAVRVYDAYNEGGIISGNIRIRAEINPLVPDLPLEGHWKFKTGDESYYKAVAYNDSNWDELMVPRAWEDQGYSDYDGMAWYRKTITLPDNLKEKRLVILLGKIDDVDEVYINGVLIGQTGEINDNYFFTYNHAWKALRGYTIPPKLHQATAQLTIAVRVQDRTQTGGIYEGPVGIITMDKYINYWNARRTK
ncbi:glycoside hydrolase [Carboxylicivirga mesophila]|uniref:Glycoside hydrolase n=1 Tax=Carboxylicivirga mesophila TaxID=1166478 RepID=A0ABS5KGQ1_9BACT|nr:glycoside hydrolase [Carboxylicivirga mesophila]MBS2213468.1 glycoside hydrolase [Carboxylicivirga mesophila]